MTKTYHDVEAVTSLLQEKEKDLELAAKIGQELLERNKLLDHKVTRLEAEIAASQELITQLKHELQVKTDLLHVYTSDLEESTPHELRTINVEVLQRKIQELEEDNRSLHAEASKLAAEAYKCEEKEEKLVNDAVKHLTEANIQIKDLHSQFTCKIDESSRQREEINMLLAQVCELQGRVQRYSHENDDLTANLRVYQETQDELTTELSDLKEKYREVVELLRDAQDQLRLNRKRTYPGIGKHNVSGMFCHQASGGLDDSLQAEITSSLAKRSSRTISNSDSRSKGMLDSEVSDSESEIPISGSSSYRKAARTYKAIARSSKLKDAGKTSKEANKSNVSSKASERSAFQSYTISRENSFSPDFEDFEFAGMGRRKFEDDVGASDDSGHGRSTEMSDSLSSSAPKEDFRARELLRQATTRSRNLSSCRVSMAAQDARTVASLASRASSRLADDTPRGGGMGDVVFTLGGASVTGGEDGLSDILGGGGGDLSEQGSHRASSPGPISALAEFFTPEYMVSAIARTKSASLTALHTGIHTRSGVFQQQPAISGSGGSGLTQSSLTGDTSGNVEVVEVPTIGVLRQPNFHLSSTLLQATPLGVVPGKNGASTMPQPETPVGLGTVPGKRLMELNVREENPEHRASSDFDETEPLGSLTVPITPRGGSAADLVGSIESLTTSPLPIPTVDEGTFWNLTAQTAGHNTNSVSQSKIKPVSGGHPGLGSVPGGHPGLGSVPGGYPGLGSVPGGHPGLGSVPGGHPGLGSVPGGHPGLGSVPGGHPGLGSVPGGHPGLGSVPGGHPGLGSVPGGHPGLGNLLTSQSSTSGGSVTSTIKGHNSLTGLGSLELGAEAASLENLGHQQLQIPDLVGGDELMDEVGGGHFDMEELEPAQSISLTSSSFSRRIDCQIVGVDHQSEGSQVPTELQSLHGCEDWSYSELREAGDVHFQELQEEEVDEVGRSAVLRGLNKTSEDARFGDSGVISGDYSELSNIRAKDSAAGARIQGASARGPLDIDALSDGGFCEMGTYPGIMVSEDSGLPPELASTLRYLNPADVERRRKALRADSMSEFAESEIVGFDEDDLPYGVNLDTTGFSDSSFRGHFSRTSSSLGGGGSGLINRMPDKLRIVKPLEGSLTLHHWSKLATPHLGGVLEERVGVAIKGNEKVGGFDNLFDIYSLEEEGDEEDDDDESVPRTVKEPTRTFNTLTNSTVLHPDTTLLSSSYKSVQMSSGFDQRSTRPASMLSSRRNSVSEPGSREGVYCVSTNLGLSKILEQKKISGVRRSQLDLRSSMTSLTPSVLSYPGSRNMSPTDTPPHTPEESLPGSPEESSGLVYSFFASLKSAIYGEQRREHKINKKKRGGRKKLGIMEAVHEVGIDNILSDRESTPGSLPGLEGYSSSYSSGYKKPTLTKSQSCLSDFDARYLGALDDFDELEEIEPGSLTINESGNWKANEDYTTAWIGQLTLPSYTVSGRPGMETTQLGTVPPTQDEMRIPVFEMGGRGPGRIMAPGEIKPHHLTGLGVPGHPGTGALKQALSQGSAGGVRKRKDLGTIPGSGFRHRPPPSASSSLHTTTRTNYANVTTTSSSTNVGPMNSGGMLDDRQQEAGGFVGSIATMFFGRKGGYL